MYVQSILYDASGFAMHIACSHTYMSSGTSVIKLSYATFSLRLNFDEPE